MQKILSRLGINPKLAWEGGWVFVLRTVNAALSFLTTVLLSRSLGAEGYGIYSYAFALVTFLVMPAEAGLPHLVVRETARGIAQDRPDLVQGIWRWSGRLVGSAAVALVFLVGLPVYVWQGKPGSLQGVTLAWALVLVPVIALGNLRGAALQGLKKVVAGQFPEFIIRPVAFIVLLGLALWTGSNLSPSLAMSLNVGAAMTAFLAGAWLLWMNTPPPVRLAKPYQEGRTWLTSSFLFAMIAGFGVINSQASTLILGMFKEPDQVGIYRVAVQVSTLAAFGIQTVNMMVAPRFADLYAQNKMDQLQRLVTVSARVVLVFNGVLTVLFLLLGNSFFGLVFGSDFAASFRPLVILLVGQLVNSIAGSVGYLLNMTGHERDTSGGMGIAAGINIVLNFLLVPFWGIHGAALASAVSMSVWNALLWWKVRQRLGLNSLAFNMGGKNR